MKIEKHLGRKVLIQGNEYLYCSGTNYLNLAYNKQFQQLVAEGMKRYGAGYGSSPTSLPGLKIYDQLASFFTHYYQCEAVCFFSSGFLASRSVVEYFIENGESINYLSFSHPSLKLNHQKNNHSMLAADIVDPIHLREFTTNQMETEQKVIVDASHAFGVHDDQVRELLRMNKVVVCGSLNKALSIPAGIVLCSASVAKELKERHSYTTSSALHPAFCYALLKAFENGLIAEQQEKLNSLLVQIPQSDEYHLLPPYPILKLTDAGKSLYQLFLEHNILIWRNEYPKLSGDFVNRIIIHAGLKRKDIERFLSFL